MKTAGETHLGRDAGASTCKKIKKGVFSRLLRQGALGDEIATYIELCEASHADNGARTKKAAQGRLPNLAGLCRFLGTGLGDLKDFSKKHPLEYDNLLAIFEDEVLNYDTSSTMLTAYLKKRLCYSSEDAEEEGEKRTEVRYCFEHDVLRDGE